MDTVARVGNGIHAAHPENPAALAERQRLFPAGCFVLESDHGTFAGYALSHPWLFSKPPALDSFLGALPAQPTTYYIHDVALLPETRGQGQAAVIVARLVAIARGLNLPDLSLIAVAGAHGFWARQGFVPYSTPALVEKLRSYGEDAQFMRQAIK